ncbi:PVC-type heme-binding CxxCH protein [Verrucomicrobium spinosum]|uniref:PVC-type heme-binding CxxCH protein n=1 Tax=Verrucomicrobium spinosum TaxID=2736 RepID=UPI000174446F|nr:PVC-type heme-binding CxxCH protein [Verrucomicrobium spinosum]
MRTPTLFLSLLALGLVGTASAQTASKELVGERAPANSICPTPEEAQKKMTVPPGYEVRCFAHEPMIENPVGMAWDPKGRLWVVELYEYPEGSTAPAPFGGEAKDDLYHPMPDLKGPIPRDRVVILEDTDNDGVADKRTVFLEGLNLACGILYGDNGVYIGQQPHLLHFRDNDGDDKPDEWRVVLTGFGREDTHELLNSFSWGPDGWLYMTHGVFTHSKVRRPGDPKDQGVVFNAGIGRCKPVESWASDAHYKSKAAPWMFEVYADGTSNPWGCDFDAAGNHFVSACVIDHLFHMSPGGLYVRQGGAPENPYSYELLPSIVNFKHFRAAYAGIQIYQGGRYPADANGHLFIGNIHDNAIHEEVVNPMGASFKAAPVRDFLRANDGWFRPVSTKTGPDGFLWVMDWCDKYPCYQNAKANPEGVDRARGRIWRVVYTGKDDPALAKAGVGSRESKDLNLEKLGTPELVKLMGHSNNWVRRTARRCLEELNDRAAAPLLLELFKTSREPSTRMEALWALNAGGVRDFQQILEAIKLAATDADPALRIWAARLTGETPDNMLHYGVEYVREGQSVKRHFYPILEKLASDADPTVRKAAAVALRGVMVEKYFMPTPLGRTSRLPEPNVKALERELYPLPFSYAIGDLDPVALENLLKSSGAENDRLIAFHLWMALEPNLSAKPDKWVPWLATVAPASQPMSRTLAYKAMRRLSDTRDAKNMDLALQFAARLEGEEALLATTLDGLVKGQESGVLKPTADPSAQLAAWRASKNGEVRKQAHNLAVLWGDKAAVAETMTLVLNDKTPLQQRIDALQVARKAGGVAILDGLQSLVKSDVPEPLLLEAVRTTAEAGGEAMPALLLQRWAKGSPAVRTAISQTLTSRPQWAALLLDAVKDHRVARADVPVIVSRFFATQKDAALKRRAEELLGVWRESNADVKALIAAKRKASLEGEPDLAAGKLMFQATCATCHEFFGGGQKVGPELIGSGRSNLDALLSNVIDPNQIIGNGYEAVNVTTKDNRTVSGRVVEDTPSHVKVLAIGGAEQIVPRDQVAKVENTHQSLMPMGFGALPDDAFRNLIWYILAPPEEGPLTREKKIALSTNMDAPVAKKPSGGTNWRAIDWESVSLWNPDWKVSAPDFERTPVKLPEYQGRKNVLLMHPFAENKPATLERKVKLAPGKPHKLTVVVASHDQGDWELRIKVGDKVIKKQVIGHDGDRWKTVAADLSEFAGQEVDVKLEGAATGWAWEFGYWGGITLE